MISPKDALDLVRAQLRSELFGRLEGDDYGQSVLIAALGVLSEISRRVVTADAWCEPSVVAMRAAATAWPVALAHASHESARRVADLVERSRAAGTLEGERALLLEAVEETLTAMWAIEPAQRDDEIIRELRALLASDTEIEVAHAGRKT